MCNYRNLAQRGTGGGQAAQKPDGYEILSSPCPSRLGGEIAIIQKENLVIAKSHEYQFSFDQCSYTLGLFYRPEDHHFLSFINDMLEYKKNNVTGKSELLMLGDINIPINKLHDGDAVTNS